MAKEWRIGCSGFHYKEWKGAFYPEKLPQGLWFDHYTQHFNTLELNVTFYRFPTIKSLTAWHDQAPEGFTFSAKVPRSITHYKKFNGTAIMLNDFYRLLREGLGNKLGCVLIQLPPQYVYSEANLQKILEQVDHSFDNVIEFRHDSWWREDVVQQLAAVNISFCGVSFPKISKDAAVINTPICYYRFHGVPVLFYSEYDQSFVANIYRQVAAATAVSKAYIYFNNTASLAALQNARQFQELVRTAKQQG